jgi:hypothetical protein
VGLRPGDEKGAPFPTRAYHPRYLPPDFAIDIAQGTPLQEPELFYLGFQRGRARPGTEPVAHALPARTLTGIAIGVPDAGALSGPARMIQDLRLVTFRTAPDHVLDLTFDRARSGGVADLRPEIPLVLSW